MSLKQPARSISPTPSQRSAHNASLSQTPPRKTRQEIATETLRKITHDVSINLADIDLLAVTRDAIHPMPIPADVYLARTTCKAYLTKKGDIRRNWKKRWFSLSLIEMSITYYTDDTEAVQKGLIYLKDVVRVFQPDTAEAKSLNEFFIVARLRTYRIRAMSPESVRVWLTLLSPLAMSN